MFFWGFHVLTNQWLVGNQWLESPSFLVSTMPWTALMLHAKAGSDGSSFLFVPSAAFPVVFLLSWGVCIYVIYIVILYSFIFINSYIQSLDIKNAIIYNPSIYIIIYIHIIYIYIDIVPPCSDVAGGVRAPGVATLRASSLSLAPSAAITAEAPGETETGGGLMGWLLIYYNHIFIIIFHYIWYYITCFHVLK